MSRDIARPKTGFLYSLVMRLIKGLNDEALSGRWEGHRSSRLGLQWRIIYRTVPDQQLFQIVRSPRMIIGGRK